MFRTNFSDARTVRSARARAHAQPVQVGIESQTCRRDEVGVRVVELHALSDITLLVGEGADQPEPEGRVGNLVANRRARPEHSVLDPQMRFAIREGGRTVGAGVVADIVE